MIAWRIAPTGTPVTVAHEAGTTGGLERFDAPLGRLIVTRLTSLQPCYIEARARRPELEGRARVTFTVARNGDVEASSIRFSEDEMADPPLFECLARRIACTRFPATDAPSEITLRLYFGPSH